MKKIINGKRYDTDTARLIGSICNNPSDRLSRVDEALYRKHGGEYFLHGEGGPMTKYSVSRGDNEWSGGEQIIPLSYASAQEWAEENLTADEYEAAFGPVTEEGEGSLLSAKLSAATHDKLRRAAAKQGVSVTAMLEQIINAAID